jgi:hypothetical protein
MIKTFSRISAAMLLLATLAGASNAQYLTSTKAGFVNNTEGKVYILRHDSEDGEKGRASLGTQMRNGDKLFTNPGSYAEILLNPGSYLRMNEKSAITVLNTDFGSVRFELVAGTVNAEVGQIDKKAPIEIVTPNGSVFLAKNGIYRFDERGGVTMVSVRQGEILVGAAQDVAAEKAAKFGRGKIVTLRGGVQADIAKLNKDAADNFDTWVFGRANTLSAANIAALRRSGSGNTVLASGWFYNSFYNCYTFMPGRRYYSPFGFGFFNSYMDGYWYNPYRWGYPSTGSGGGGVIASAPPRIVMGADRQPIQREPGPRILDSRGGMDAGFGSGRGFGGSGGGVSAPSAPVVVSSSPAPARTSDSGGGGGMPTRP